MMHFMVKKNTINYLFSMYFLQVRLFMVLFAACFVWNISSTINALFIFARCQILKLLTLWKCPQWSAIWKKKRKLMILNGTDFANTDVFHALFLTCNWKWKSEDVDVVWKSKSVEKCIFSQRVWDFTEF